MTRALALLLTVLTGFSGLVYEVSWQKYLATLLGSHSEATAAVLGIFLGGLSLGYALFGSVTRRVLAAAERRARPPRLLLLYGAVEAGIGVWALAFPILFDAVRALSIAIPLGAGASAFAADVLLAALLIGPPTVLMGGTIPILTQALAHSLADATRFHAFVYAFNTAGAFAGALCAGFVLVPWLGLAAVVRWMGIVNLSAGSLFVLLGLPRRAAALAPPSGVAPALPPGFAAYAGVALLSGFAMMTIQTVLNRIGALAFGASQFTFSMVVAVFVLCIALGSFAVSALPRIRPLYLVASQWLLFALLALLYFELPDAPYWAHVLRSLFRDNPEAFYPYYGCAFLCILALLAVPIGLSGATLPLLFHHLRREVSDLGAVAGRLYSWNTLGSLLGALIGGHLLLIWLDLTHVYRISLAALALGATILSVRIYRLSPVAVGTLLLLPLFAGLVYLPSWNHERLSAGLFRNRAPMQNSYRGPDAFFSYESAIRFYDDDPSASVAVKESRQGNVLARSIHNNGKSDGSIPADYPTMALVALIPSLLAESHERGFVIGYGTGVSVGELAALPGTREVVVAEISQGVVKAASWFDYGNQQASRNPKVRIVRGDAYRALLRSEGRYDVIASEPSNPWVTGVEMLFSREFLQAAKSRLTPGGIYAQWFHVYETDQDSVTLVLRSYASVFDHVAVWYGIGPDLLLLAFNDPARALDLEQIEARAAQPAYAAALRRGGVGSFAALLAHELLPLDVLSAMALGGPVHTLLHPILSHEAARAFFHGGSVQMPPSAGANAARVGGENSLLRRWLAKRGGAFGEDERGAYVSEVCLHRPIECSALLAQWKLQEPGSPGLAATLAAVRGNPAFARHLAPAVFATLTRLYAGPAADGAETVTVAAAQQATTVFQNHYTHAAPFSRAALLDAWRRCRDGQALQERCRGGLRAAEQRLGPLSDEAGEWIARPER